MKSSSAIGMNHRCRVFDVRTGEQLWQTRLEQCVAVSIGLGGGSPRIVPSRFAPEILYSDTGNALYVFALAE